MNPKRSRKIEEKFVVRLPLGMRESIARKAQSNSRSMNGEIVYRLARADELELALHRANQVIDQLLASGTDTFEA